MAASPLSIGRFVFAIALLVGGSDPKSLSLRVTGDRGPTLTVLLGTKGVILSSSGARILEQVGPAAGPKVVW